MAFRIHHAATRAAVAAATSQQAQCEALRDAFSGNVEVRIYGAGSQHLRTVVLAGFGINSNTPRGLTCGAAVSDTAIAPSTPGAAGITPTLWEFRDGGTVIFTSDEISHGAIKTLCTPTFGSVVFTAQASLPVTDVSFTLRQVEANGISTPGTIPQAWYRSGSLYLGWTDTLGRSGVTKYTAPSTQQRTVLSTSTDYNSHNNCALEWTSDGRLIAIWCQHLDSGGLNVRVASAVESVTGGFSTSVRLADGNYTTYAQTFRLSQTGALYVMARVNRSTTPIWPRRVWSSTDNGANWTGPRTWISNGTDRVYPVCLSDGVKRVDMVWNDSPPQEGTAALRHAYMELDGSNVETFYKTDGTLIGTSGATSGTATTVDDAASGKTWPYDLILGPDGELWCIYMRFVTTSDHRVMFVKTTGGKAAWGTPVEVAATGGRLYEAETYSHPGAVFDRTDPTKMAVIKKVAGVHEVFRYSTANNGATWTEGAQLTTGSTYNNFQIVSPTNHGGNVPFLWCGNGPYTDWNSGFDTEMVALVKD